LFIFASFIPVFIWLRMPLLALSTRIGIGICMLLALDALSSDLGDYLGSPDDARSEALLRSEFLAGLPGDLVWPAFVLIIGLAATLRIQPAYQIAWWRGIVRARHMALMRRGTRLVISNANRIAFVGGFISAGSALFNWIRYAGGDDSGQRSRDFMVIGSHVYAVAVTVLCLRYLFECCNVDASSVLRTDPLDFAKGDISFVIACAAWGGILYLRGVLDRDYLARFFAIGFVAAPLAMFTLENDLEDQIFLALTLLVVCATFFTFGLMRRFHK
jgi:hypothetical protein